MFSSTLCKLASFVASRTNTLARNVSGNVKRAYRIDHTRYSDMFRRQRKSRGTARRMMKGQ